MPASKTPPLRPGNFIWLDGEYMAAPQDDNIVTQSWQTTSDSLLFGFWSRQDARFLLLKLLVAIFIVALLVLLAKLFSKFVARRLRSNSIVDDEYTSKVSGLVGEIIFYTLLVIALLIGFMIVGIDFGRILWWISFWIWFAFKEILGNLIAGILVLTNKEFKLWDIIVVDDDTQEYFWRIEEITIRYTVIRTFDLRKVIIPNLTLILKPVKTYDSEDVVRLQTVLTVHYGTNLHDACEQIKEAINNVDYVREKESTRVSIRQFTERGAEILIFFYIDPKSWMLIETAISGVHHAIFDMFKKEGIIIPYPHTAVTVDYNDKNLLWSMLYVAKESQKDE